MSLSISLFGRFEISREDESYTSETSEKSRELLAYLLLNRNRAHPREKLASVLWGRVTTGSSMAYLRKALWKLRKVVEGDCGAPLLRVDRDWIEINPDAEFWLDVDVFEQTFDSVRDAAVTEIDARRADALRACAHLYRGDLLENWYRDWCSLERRRLQDSLLVTLDKLVALSELHGRYEAGIQYALRALSIDPARECTHRGLMRLRYLAGDRTGALRQYQECARTLDRELSVVPSSSTERLNDLIRNDDALDGMVGPQGPVRGPRRRSGAPYRPHRGLREIQQALVALQTCIRRQLALAEGTSPEESELE